MMNISTTWLALIRVEMGSFDKVGGESKASGYLCGGRLLASILHRGPILPPLKADRMNLQAGQVMFLSRNYLGNQFVICNSGELCISMCEDVVSVLVRRRSSAAYPPLSAKG